MSSSSSSVLIGSAVLLTAAAAATTYLVSSRQSEETAAARQASDEIGDIDDEIDMEETITADEVNKIFERLFLEMQAVVAQLSQTVQQIQMSGQVIPEQQLRQLLRTEFERSLSAKQKPVLDEFGIDYDCLEEATWEFLEKEEEFPQVKKSFERFQKLWENISGERVVGKRPGGVGAMEDEDFEILSAAKTIEAAEVYFDALTKAMGELVQQFKADGKDLRAPMVGQELQMEFSSVADDAGGDALGAINVSRAQFQKSIEANAQDPQVGRSLAMLQMKQQQAMMAMGVPGG
eukprot:CAMPEP_0113481432 /NCGR_PEP_ID=MMETSP0014_2-20120614/22406_1 /TAXON_ID=2857 /ORGANISM="Nitzschia sp." /LENGTH=290 /DNA_ID=CAMNT_0000374929 /DNA_START=60 /DNA_END=932 /DNA_ORIENTATION=- /assembly_acc=CAM_ASM_000159